MIVNSGLYNYIVGVIDSLEIVIFNTVELQLKGIQAVAQQILDLEIYFHTLNIREAIYSSIFSTLKDGFAEFISLAITSKNYQGTTNQTGQISISMKDYVYSQMTTYLSTLDKTNLSYKLVDDYLGWLSGGNEANLRTILANQTGWFTSFNDFVFYFNINNSRTTHVNYAGYVDEKYGYETFIVSGQTARRYINPYYFASLDVGQDAWDVDTSFFLPVPREALQDFKIEIPEFTSEMLIQSNLVYQLNGYLNAKDNGNQIISLFRKSGTEYIFVKDLKTHGDDSTTTRTNIETTPIFSQTSTTRAKLLSSKLNYFTEFKNNQIQTLEGQNGIVKQTKDINLYQQDEKTIDVKTGKLVFNFAQSINAATLASTQFTTDDANQGYFDYSFDLENLGVGQHEFMFEYGYEVPEIYVLCSYWES